jgi:MFS family permease
MLFIKLREFLHLAIIALFQGALAGAIAPVFPLWLRDYFGISLQDIFYIMALIGIGSSIINVTIGNITDRLGNRKAIFLVMIALVAVRNFLYAFLPNLILVIVTLWITQLSTSAIIFSIVNDKIDKHRANMKLKSEYINTFTRISVTIGFSIGAPTGLLIVSALSYQWFYIIYGISYCLAFLLVFVLIKEDVILAKKERNPMALKGFVKNIKVSLVVFVVLFFLFSGNQSMNTILSLFVTDSHTINMLGALMAYSVAFEVPFFLVSAKLIERIGAYRAMQLAAIVCAFYFLLLMISSHLAMLFVAQALGAFVTSLLFLSTMTYVQRLFENQTGYANFFYFTSVMMVSILGSAFVGRLIYLGFSAVFGILACSVTIAIVILFFVNRYVVKRGS